jgi:hypothetical protein
MTLITIETPLPPNQWPDLDKLQRMLAIILRDQHVRVHLIKR